MGRLAGGCEGAGVGPQGQAVDEDVAAVGPDRPLLQHMEAVPHGVRQAWGRGVPGGREDMRHGYPTVPPPLS